MLLSLFILIFQFKYSMLKNIQKKIIQSQQTGKKVQIYNKTKLKQLLRNLTNRMSNKKTLKFDKEQITENRVVEEVFNFAHFKKNLQVQIIERTKQSMQMELKGIDASISNAIRRIIIAQIPTMAFHKVFLYQNTSVLPDQLLVHRIGLLPISIDSKNFEYKKQDQQFNGQNSIKFELKVTCRRKKQYQNLSDQQLQKKGLKPQQYLENANIYSKQLKFIDQGHKSIKNVTMLHDNILIAKLRENQQINLEIYAQKGAGKKHAKWSPVSTCFYRLMPDIQISDKFNHQKNAQALVNCCPVNVYSLDKKKKAVVSNSRACTTCRQCIALQGVELGKIKDHFIFTIESIGVYKPEQIFLTALDILEEKAKNYII